MIKKGIIAATLMAGVTSAIAGGVEVPPPYVGGFYLGVGISRDDQYSHFMSTSQATFNGTSVQNLTTTTPAGLPGWDGQIVLGYGHQFNWNHFYLGAEIFAAYSSMKASLSDERVFPATPLYYYSQYKLRSKRSFGFAAMPGWYADKGSLFYGRVGYVNTQFQQFGFFESTGVNYGAAVVMPNFKTSKSGLQLGLGVNTQITPHLSLREEYVWERYGRINSSATGTSAVGGASTATQTTSSRSNIERANLDLVYYFSQQGNAPDRYAELTHSGNTFYLGAQFTRTLVPAEEQTVFATPQDIRLREFYDVKARGFNAEGLIGYGYGFSNHYYLGLEFFGGMSSLELRSQTIDYAVATLPTKRRLTMPWNLGLSVLPGYQVSDNALLYLRAGMLIGKMDFNSISPNLIYNFGKSSVETAAELGLGVDTLLTNSVSARFEYDITRYGDFTARSRIITGNVVTSKYKIPLAESLKIAFIWHWYDQETNRTI